VSATAAGLDPRLTADDRTLLWIFGDMSERGESVQ
jgi:hypothetical protein